jgi:CubicO group peptidase (beta-lactamase class C family)
LRAGFANCITFGGDLSGGSDMRRKLAIALGLCTLGGAATAQQTAPFALDNKASDPRALGWMQGAPVPPDKTIRYSDGSYWTFPKLRWSFSNMQQIMPTLPIQRSGPVRSLPYALRGDIDGIRFKPIGSDKEMTFRESLDANYTDGLVIMHRGRIVYEHTFGAYDMSKAHAAASVTKSFVGLIATMQIHEGKIDPAKAVVHYLPELAGSGFADATVQQVLDMTTGLAYDENYVDPNEATRNYFVAGGFTFPPDYQGPRSTYAALAAIGKKGGHGDQFTYRSPNTDVLGWIVVRIGGKPLNEQMQDRFWSKLGMERDAHIWVDSSGTPFAAGGLSLQLRDLARFAEMLRNDGRVGKVQVVPRTVIADIRGGADRGKFAGYPTLPGWSYRNQFWISHDDHGMYMGRGVHGQMFYVNPKAELVVARFGSHPIARNGMIDPTSLPAWRALAEHLMGKGK